jgi:hypothetical protein
MRRFLRVFLLAPLLSAAPLYMLADVHRHTAHASLAESPAGNLITDAAPTKPVELPPLPAGVEELKFSEFFQQPVGPRGLEYTEKLQRLNGHRVRVLGYMVEQSQPAPRCLLLAPIPVKLHEDEWGFCEDMPAAVVHVFVDPSASDAVPFTPGLMLLTGTLSVGNRVESDQRVSTVRLQLDPPAAGEHGLATAAAQKM